MDYDKMMGSHVSNVKLGKVERLAVLGRNSDVKTVNCPAFVEETDGERRSLKLTSIKTMREDGSIKPEGGESEHGPALDCNRDFKKEEYSRSVEVKNEEPRSRIKINDGKAKHLSALDCNRKAKAEINSVKVKDKERRRVLDFKSQPDL
ncbi:hypothetical protein DSO57_1012419 [Entomophthora muscae]|uniref:Uncharacterized protein n=1 Tax=Entomophthora muscae TaxID=34485 RepID=A0ACC2USL6_9FUNG|nr:hypothetical protein DSO57_1012419 [Entomophthora muscae]